MKCKRAAENNRASRARARARTRRQFPVEPAGGPA